MWWQYTLAIIAGSLIGFFPNTTQNTLDIFRAVALTMTGIGTYLVFPSAFLSIIIAIHQLMSRKLLLKSILFFALLLILFTVISSILGIGIGFGLISDRIPPTPQETPPLNIPPLLDQLSAIFPDNFFHVFTGSSSNLLPLVVLAFIFGIMMYREHQNDNLLFRFSQSMWSMMYRLLSIMRIILIFSCTFLAAHSVLQIRTILEINIFLTLVLVLTMCILLIVCIVYPLLLTFLIGASPRTWFSNMLPPAISALVTGNVLFSTATLYTAHEDTPASNHMTSTLGLLFCRVGTVLVTGSSFIVVLRSYSALEIQFQQIALIFSLLTALSLAISYAPEQSIIVLLSSLSVMYNENTQELYFILLPIMLILTRLGAFMDVMTIGCINHIISARHKDILNASQKTISRILQ